jgi:type VI secretion system protein ImpA
MSDFLLKLLQPIEGPNPAGSYLRNEPDDDGLTVYDKIKKARTEEIDPITGDQTAADHAAVEKLAVKALETRTKDLQLAAWLTEALLKREGIHGLRNGLELIHGFLDQFWDHLHPEIEDDDTEMRAVLLTWIGDYLDVPVRFAPLNKGGHHLFEYQEALAIGYEEDANADAAKAEARKRAIQEGKITPEEFDRAFESTSKQWYKDLVADVDSSIERLGVLDDLGSERFGSDAPSYRNIKNALTDVQGAARGFLAKKLELDPDPVELEPVDGEGAGATTAATPGSQQLSAEPTDRDSAGAHIAAAARFLQRDDPTNPAPYLMLRGYRWGELRANGSDVDPRLLAAPPTNARTKLKGLLLDSKWPELLTACETVMAAPHGRGWLDLQRYVMTALEALGAEYEHVAEAVRGALVGLLQDLPELPQLTLMDDTQTANAETRGWLRELFAASVGAAGSAVVIGEDDEQVVPHVEVARASSKTVYDRAMSLLRSGQAEKAIRLLMSQADQEKSSRARFLRRTEAADIMVETGHEAVAMPILRELAGQVDTHQLEEWEAGDTVARPLSLLYRCMQTVGAESEDVRQALYLRVCRLDPLRAISFPGKKQGAGQSGPKAAEAVSPAAPPDAASPPRIDASAMLESNGSSGG